jgi:hypothetical protein
MALGFSHKHRPTHDRGAADISDPRSWTCGHYDNRFDVRLSAQMIAKRSPDSSVPISLLADHPHVHYHYYRPAIGTVEAEMH